MGQSRRGGISMKIGLAADHGGFEMKQVLIARLRVRDTR